VEVSDEALCRRVAERDDGAFDALVERYQRRAYGIAWSILRDAEEARDLSQEAFIRLYENAHRFRGQARFSTWFYRILVNLCLDHRRRHRWWRRAVVVASPGPRDETGGPLDALVDAQPAPVHDPLDDLDREQAMKQLWAAVEGLSPQQRAVLHLVADDMPTAEIASVLRCSEATVRVHLHRALVALRKTMRRS
jgi:RNA polymerase sigma-70 factor (ECF subfamily)